MKRKHIQKPAKQKMIALERINVLFKEAKKAFKDEPEFADRYVQLARKIAMKYKVKIPAGLKRSFCKRCNKYLMPGTNSQVRSHKGHIVFYCLSCKSIMRFRYK
jgi:ribonuclease P protein subunit RPR2